MSKQTRRIEIKVDTTNARGLDKLAKQFGHMNKNIKHSTSVLTTFRNAFLAIQGLSFAGFGVSEITGMMDSFQKLGDRITVFEGSAAKANTTLEGLAQVSERTKSAIDGAATIYSRLALSLDEAGLSSTSLLFLTEQLQQSFRLSGSTAAEATASTIQLSQGLASGTLRGQELRSVLESNALVGKFLAKELNASRGQLMKLAEAGKITSDVFLRAMLKGSEELTEGVSKLGITFKEANDQGLNRFKIALGGLNKQFELSKKYSNFLTSFADNIKGFAAAALGIAATAIPVLVAKLKVLAVALFAANPAAYGLSLAIGAVTSATAYAMLQPDGFAEATHKALAKAKQYWYDLGGAIWIAIDAVARVGTLGTDNPLTRGTKIALDTMVSLSDAAEAEAEEVNRVFKEIEKGENALLNAGVLSRQQQLKKFQSDLQKMKIGADDSTLSAEKRLAKLNTLFSQGGISLVKYEEKLRSLTTEIYAKKGPIPLAKALEKLDKESLGRLLESGSIKMEEFQKRMNALSISHLNAQLASGRISAKDYDKQIIDLSEKFQPRSALRVGMDDYINSVGTVSRNVAGVVTQAFGHLENTLLDFMSTGKLNFKKFTNDIIQDINRMIVRAMIVRPLAQGIMGSFGSTPTPDVTPQALGGVWDKGVQKFAKGGVVDSPTYFKHSSGKGLMGEAGPEAIIPLKRNSKGELGVSGEAGGASANVVVNIINNSDTNVEQRESTDENGSRTLDLIITNKMKESFAKGHLDKTMQMQYGIKRKGY